MRIEIDSKTFWDDFIYVWNGNKARRKRRIRIQKAKRASRRKTKMELRKF